MNLATEKTKLPAPNVVKAAVALERFIRCIVEDQLKAMSHALCFAGYSEAEATEILDVLKARGTDGMTDMESDFVGRMLSRMDHSRQ